MRVIATIKESEFTKLIRDFEHYVEDAYRVADDIALKTYAGKGIVSLDQNMETEQGTFKIAFSFNIGDERMMRKEISAKAEALKTAIKDYEKVLIKKMILVSDALQDQGTTVTSLE